MLLYSLNTCVPGSATKNTLVSETHCNSLIYKHCGMRESEAIKLKYEKYIMSLALGTCNYNTQLVIKQKGFIEEMSSNLRC